MAVFSTPRINASWLAAGPLLPATARSYRLFARPQRLPPLGDLHSGVKAPSLLLRFLPSTLVVPVRPFGSAAASRFAPVAAVSLPLARCTSTTRFGLPRLRSPLPSGIFPSLGIKAFNRLCRLPVHLTNPPDFLSLPAARPNKSWGCGSSFQVRYVSAGLLFLKPLGTFFTMLPMCVSVNAFLGEMAPFPPPLFDIVSNQLQSYGGARPVDNTRVAENVLLQFEDHAVVRGQPQIPLVGAGQRRPPGDGPVIHCNLGPGTHVAALENLDIPGYDTAHLSRRFDPCQIGRSFLGEPDIGDKVALVAKDGLVFPRDPVEFVDFARIGGGVAVLDQPETRAVGRTTRARHVSEQRRRSGSPGLAAITRHHGVGEVRRLAAAQRILGVHPRRKPGTPAHRRLIESENNAIVPIGEADPGVGRALGCARRIGGRLDGLPPVAAIVSHQHRLLIAGGPTVVLVGEIDPPWGSRRFRQLLPVLAGFVGLPDAFFRHHPAQAVIQKE